MNPVISICIPTFNNAQQLLGCLSSILRYVESSYVIHILNNGMIEDESGEKFTDFIHARFPDEIVRVYDLGENTGWMGALNYAWRNGLMQTPFTLVCNDDVVFLPFHRQTLMNMTRYIVNYPQVGAVGPCTNVVMGSQNLAVHHLPLAFQTSLLIGFCCMFRTEALSKIGNTEEVWDASLPGGDDLDISIRLRNAGYSLVVDRSIYVHHIGFQTGQRVHGSYWNSDEQRIASDNAIIRKHGVIKWFECLNAMAWPFDPITQKDDGEGDWIRSKLDGGRGIDIGCGANKTVSTAVGMDRVERGQAGTTGGRRGVPSKADMVADACDVPVADESQDYIVARHIMEHIVDSVGVLREWKRILKPGGDLVMACPNENKTPTIMLDSEHVHAFTPSSLSDLLSINGFEVVDSHEVEPGFTFCVHARKQ